MHGTLLCPETDTQMNGENLEELKGVASTEIFFRILYEKYRFCRGTGSPGSLRQCTAAPGPPDSRLAMADAK